MLPDHPVIHGLHQHQDHIFSFQQAGHGILAAGCLLGKIAVNLGGSLGLGLCMGRSKGIDFVGIQILDQGLVQAADLVKAVGVEHIVIGGFGRLGAAIVGLRISNIVILLEHCLR